MPSSRLPALLLAAGLASCGGSPEKEGLRAYELAVEGPMAEDGRVAGDLSDLRKDLLAANAGAEDQGRYAREQGIPFYRRFRESMAAVPVLDPRLAEVHRHLLAYADHRLAYLDAIDRFLAATESEALRRLRDLQGPWEEAQRELMDLTGGQIEDREAAEAMTVRQLFMERVLGPFQRGQAPRDRVEEALRKEVLPRLERAAAKPPGPGPAGAALAKWARAELAFFREIAGTLAQQEALQATAIVSQDEWDAAEERRAQYLEELKAYRGSLR